MTELDKYIELNNSFKKEYIFHLGAEAGFYSEFNNMVFAILYCLKHEYKFILYSKDANFGYKNGWKDYFMPFCDETTFFIHTLFNKRTKRPNIKKRHYPLWIIYRILFKNTYFTYELWSKYYSKDFDNEMFDFPSLKIHGNLREASSIIVKMIYRFNDETTNMIKAHINKLALPSSYNSMQIRRGDKLNEVLFLPIDKYFNRTIELSPLKDLFLLTDDFSVIEKVKNTYPNWNILTLTECNEKGYIHSEFTLLPDAIKKHRLIKLFASIEIARSSNLFVGTFTTNTGFFLAMAMPFNKVISIQKKEWFQFSTDDVINQLTLSYINSIQ